MRGVLTVQNLKHSCTKVGLRTPMVQKCGEHHLSPLFMRQSRFAVFSGVTTQARVKKIAHMCNTVTEAS